MAKVLVVVHNRSELRSIVGALQQEKMNVRYATDGLQGLELFREQRPDAVIVNLLIPKLPGGELCKKIKEDPQNAAAPVILISGLFKKTDLPKMARESWQADRFIQAPYTPAQLIEALHELLPAEKFVNAEPATESIEPASEEDEAEEILGAEPPAAPAAAAPKREESLEDLLSRTLAELDGRELIDRSPRVAKIDEGIKRAPKPVAAAADDRDKISELLDEVTSIALGDNVEKDDWSLFAPEAEKNDEETTREGDLEEISIPELFAQLFFAEKSGILEVQHQGTTKNVYFDQGRAVYVESEGRQESLGQILVQQGVIDSNDVLSSLESMATNGKRQGNALVDMGRLTPMQLYQALRFQMREKLLNLFGWFEGKFYFDETPFDINSLTVFELPMPRLILDGILQAYDAESLREMFTEVGEQVVTPISPPPFSSRHAGLSKEVWLLLKLIDGKRTINQVVKASPLDEEHTFPLLYAMLILRLYESVSEAAEEMPEEIEVEEELTAIDEEEEILIEQEEAPAPPPQRPAVRARELTPIDAGEDELVDDEEEPAPAKKSALLDDDDVIVFDEMPAEEVVGEEEAESELELELRAFEAGGEEHELVPIDQAGAAPDDLRQRIMDLYLKLESSNHYEILGVERGADAATIKGAYHRLVQQFHEDKIGPALTDAETKQQANSVMQAITTAYETLSSPAKRGEYDRRLTPDGEEIKERRITTILAAERAFNQGVLAMRRQAFVDALNHFAEACKLFPEEGEYHAYLGWAQWNNPNLAAQDRTAQAKESIERSIKINPKGDKAYFFLGKILAFHNQKDKARRMFALAFRYNKNNDEAKNELRRLQVERERERLELAAAAREKDNLLGKEFDIKSVKNALKKLFS
ncbi:MAG TPA: DnaJ domain-containing protein [bacterium]|nr:DnaJ domain-containing protein [bacterium]